MRPLTVLPFARIGAVVSSPCSRQNMSLDQGMERPHDYGASADLVGQRRYAEINALAGIDRSRDSSQVLRSPRAGEADDRETVCARDACARTI
jgi:hypothetical protein